MKSISYLLTFLLFCLPFTAKAELSLDDLIGVYTIKSDESILYTYEGIKVEYILAISKKKTSTGENIIGMSEIFKQVTDDGKEIVIEKLECQGIADLKFGVITSNISCKNGASFEQRVRLSDAEGNILNGKFSAPVFSSLYGTELVMNFSKQDL